MTEHTEITRPDDEYVLAEILEEPEVIDPHSLGIELPEAADEAIQVLLRAVSDARSEATAYLDDLRRVAADSENFRKRMLRDHAVNIERASERVVQGLLPTLDSFDAALALEPETTVEEQMIQGLRRTHTQLIETLGKEGLEVIPTVGEPFDPSVHEAATAPSNGEGVLVVTGELRRGYRLKDRVLRPALVAVDYE
ncbi:MAG TPA: nucleotide exchange factor GrpE [Acidimicrobiia bacterium]